MSNLGRSTVHKQDPNTPRTAAGRMAAFDALPKYVRVVVCEMSANYSDKGIGKQVRSMRREGCARDEVLARIRQADEQMRAERQAELLTRTANVRGSAA